MKTLPKINALILIIFLSVTGFSQSVEDGWKGIKPLKTNKAEVDKILGESEMEGSIYRRYSTDEAFVRVNYSTAPCQNKQYNKGKYNIPKDTVLDYFVKLKKLKLISIFDLKLDEYEKKRGDLINFINYSNYKVGIEFLVIVQEQSEYVLDIRYTPSRQDEETFKCKEVKKDDSLNIGKS